MPSPDPVKPPPPDPRQEPSVAGMVQLVKDYARQETVGPIRGAGRWLAFGAVGAILFGVATILLMLAAVRLLETETDAFDGQWMGLIPYLVAIVIGGVAIAIAVTRIASRKSLQKEP